MLEQVKRIWQEDRIHKQGMEQPAAFLHANNEQSRKGFKKTIPFAMASKRIKYSGINLTKEVKDRYVENYETLAERRLKKTE